MLNMTKLEKAEQWADRILEGRLTENKKIEWKQKFLCSLTGEFNISDTYNTTYLELETYLNQVKNDK